MSMFAKAYVAGQSRTVNRSDCPQHAMLGGGLQSSDTNLVEVTFGGDINAAQEAE
jgi:hypothetical protein